MSSNPVKPLACVIAQPSATAFGFLNPMDCTPNSFRLIAAMSGWRKAGRVRTPLTSDSYIRALVGTASATMPVLPVRRTCKYQFGALRPKKGAPGFRRGAPNQQRPPTLAPRNAARKPTRFSTFRRPFRPCRHRRHLGRQPQPSCRLRGRQPPKLRW
jgi:hypothetical protein